MDIVARHLLVEPERRESLLPAYFPAVDLARRAGGRLGLNPSAASGGPSRDSADVNQLRRSGA